MGGDANLLLQVTYTSVLIGSADICMFVTLSMFDKYIVILIT